MTDIRSTSLLIRTLSNILNDNFGLEVFDYSRAEDFAWLWSKEPPAAKHILIVWPQTAPDEELIPINVADCLSPVDWAVCFASQGEDQPGAWPDVMILDINPTLHGRTPSVAHFNTLKQEQLPWLRMQTEVQLSTIIDWLATSSDRDSKRCKAALQRFLREISLTLTEVKSEGAYDRHAVSNLIGPMILRGQVAKKSLHSTALLRLLKACGLVPSSVQVTDFVPDASTIEADKGLVASYINDQNRYPWPDWVTDVASDSAATQTDQGLGILLVDDQAEHGWAEWVKESLPGISMAILKNPTALVMEIKRQLEEGQPADSKAKDLRFRLSFPRLPADKAPILLLDLRLFSGNIASELAFYKDTLCPLMQRFTDKNDLAWPAFSSENKKFTAALAAVNDNKLVMESPEHREALTWLPRILALADMSLPIVLFSSTDRKSVTTPLLPYRNIFVSFQKPSLSSLSDPSICTTTLAKFKETIAAATTFGAIRRKCLSIQALAEQVKHKKRDKVDRLHVELYLDETGNPNSPDFSVGGVFGVFSTVKESDMFEDLCVTHGLRYFKENLFQPHASAALNKWADNGLSQLSAALAAFRTPMGKQVPLGYVRLRLGNIEHNPALADNSKDGRLHRMLSALVELFCSESLPAISEQYNAPIEKISLSVYLGTRMIPLQLRGDFTYQENVDIQIFRDDNDKDKTYKYNTYLQSMGGRDAFPIVRNAIERHSPLALISVKRAIAVSLPYEGIPNAKRRISRVVHRPSASVYKFDLKRDVNFTLVQPARGAYGEVVKPCESNIYVRVIGVNENVYCSRRDCGYLFADFTWGTLVKLDVEPNTNSRRSGFVGTNVRAACENEYITWIEVQSPKVSSWFLQRAGAKVSDCRPDYRALHYVADQILFGTTIDEFEPCIPGSLEQGIAGQFDADLDQELETSIAASRSLDAGQLSDALRLFSESPARRPPLRQLARAYLAHRLWSKLANCGGEALCVVLGYRRSP